jgi:putative membrane protein
MTNPEAAERDPRVYFAAERTFLAWIRTGLGLMGVGFAVARFGLFLREMQSEETHLPVHATGLSVWSGVALVALGVIVNVTSVFSHIATVHRLKSGHVAVRPSLDQCRHLGAGAGTGWNRHGAAPSVCPLDGGARLRPSATRLQSLFRRLQWNKQQSPTRNSLPLLSSSFHQISNPCFLFGEGRGSPRHRHGLISCFEGEMGSGAS